MPALVGRLNLPVPAKSAKQLKKRRSVVYPTCIILFTCQSIQRTAGRQKHESKSTDRNALKETRGRRLLKIELTRYGYRRRTRHEYSADSKIETPTTGKVPKVVEGIMLLYINIEQYCFYRTSKRCQQIVTEAPNSAD